MLRDVFAILVPGGSVESPLIWESSRFAINPDLSVGPGRQDVNQFVNSTTIELLCGLVEAAQLAGALQISVCVMLFATANVEHYSLLSN